MTTNISTDHIRRQDESDCLCPKCKTGHIRFSPKGYAYCSDKDCKFIMSTTVFGKKLTEKTIVKLLTTGTTGSVIKGFKSSAGKVFDCVLKLSPEYKVIPDFPERTSQGFDCRCPKCGQTAWYWTAPNLHATVVGLLCGAKNSSMFSAKRNSWHCATSVRLR